jgi:hypothetical protein
VLRLAGFGREYRHRSTTIDSDRHWASSAGLNMSRSNPTDLRSLRASNHGASARGQTMRRRDFAHSSAFPNVRLCKLPSIRLVALAFGHVIDSDSQDRKASPRPVPTYDTHDDQSSLELAGTVPDIGEAFASQCYFFVPGTRSPAVTLHSLLRSLIVRRPLFPKRLCREHAVHITYSLAHREFRSITENPIGLVKISLPTIGMYKAGGKTSAAVQDELSELYKKQLQKRGSGGQPGGVPRRWSMSYRCGRKIGTRFRSPGRSRPSKRSWSGRIFSRLGESEERSS